MLYCFNCQKTYNHSEPKCPVCQSQAVQLRNNRNSSQSEPRQRSNQRNVMMPFSGFQQIQRIFQRRRNNMLGGYGMRDFESMGSLFSPNFGMMQMQMPQFSEEDYQRGPIIYQRIIRSGPQGTVIYQSSNQQNEHEQIQYEVEPESRKIDPNNFPKINNMDQECYICHSKQNEGVILPCGHKFHKDCLKPWFEIKDNCPCCRSKL